MHPFRSACLIKELKLPRILVILRGLSAMFWDTGRFMNQLLVSPCEAKADYTCWKYSSLIFSQDVLY